MPSFQIVGSVQVRNEDIYVERAVSNILDFCDKVIITDHHSTDQTFEICKRLAEKHSKVELISIETPSEAANAIEPYFATNSWIFGVDGDEVYDPHGLTIMRKKLLNGEFSDSFCVFGNVLNVTWLDGSQRRARGHLAPPSRSMTKLYNFAMVESWTGCPERLLGGDLRFKDGFTADLRRYLHEEIDWDHAYFRCLHMPFMKRSSRQKIRLSRTRLNPDEINRINHEKNLVLRMFRTAELQIQNFMGMDWKNQKYRRGSLVEKDATVFFQDQDIGGS